MGLVATLAMERRQSSGWQTIGDLLYPYEMQIPAKGKKPRKKTVANLHYNTMPHNRLVIAHLLGAFETQSVGEAPESFDDDLRIAGKHRGLPKDVDPTTTASMGDRSHMGHGAKPSWCSLKEILAFDWTQSIPHRFWVNGPMALEWYRQGYATMPGHVETYLGTMDRPQATDAIVVELDELKGLVEKCVADCPFDKRGERMAAWAGCRWAYVEREYPLLSLCNDFIGCVVGQLLDGKSPEDARVICWVS